MKYIDADKLNAEIERLNSLVYYESKDRHDEGLHDAYKAVKNVINSLQQEQPEVDLEKEIDRWFSEKYMQNMEGLPIKPIVQIIAHYFFELVLNTQKGK